MTVYPLINQRPGRGPWRCWLLLTIALAALGLAAPSLAQQTPDETAAASSSALPAEVAESIDADLARMGTLGTTIQRLEDQLAGAEGLALQVLEARLARYWNELIDTAHGIAQKIVTLAEEGKDVAAYRETIETVLAAAPAALFAEIDRAAANISLPATDQGAAEQAAIDANASLAFNRVTYLYRALLKNIDLAREFDLPTDAVTTELNARLEERAAGASAFLDIAIADADAARQQLAALPADTEIAARLAVAQARVSLSSETLKGMTSLMAQQELDTSVYDAQLIATTGEITTDIFDLSVLGGLVGDWFSALGGWFAENGGTMLFSILVFLAIVLGTFKLATIVQRLVGKGLASARVEVSQLLQRMIVSTARSVIIVVGLLIALSQLGISLGPLLAGLGIAGFVIGFALQDSLSNFASGMMILLYKPFDVGDLVEVSGGVFGTVSYMSLVNTTVLTVDNQTLVVPNNSIWQNVIKNVTAQNTRRIDLVFGIGYSDDIPTAEKILTEIVESHAAVLKDPEPMVRLHELGDSAVNFIVRPWVKTEDYWPVYWDITRAVKLRFDAEGVSIPFPQRDVHLFTETPLVATTATTGELERNTVPEHRGEFDTASSSAQDDD